MKKTYEKPTFHKTQYISTDSIAFEGIMPLGGTVNVKTDISNCTLFNEGGFDLVTGNLTNACSCWN